MTAIVSVRVPAKVNLSLRVGGAGADGYHELATVFQALSLHDDVAVRAAAPGEFTIAAAGEGAAHLPVGDDNLALRAARLLALAFDVAGAGVAIRLRKRIPVAGGMAGGSADAAAALVACDRLWGTGATAAELADLAARLGADVPFLLLGGTALGTGRGDVLRPVAAAGEYHWTLALAHAGLSTPAVFRRFDDLGGAPQPQAPEVPADLLAALAVGNVPAVGAALVNDLQPAALSLQPTLERTLAIGLEAGARGAVVSGSGPTCAFLSEDAESADRVATALGLSSGVRAVRRARGPVPGARLIEEDR